MKTYELIAPCHFGLESILKREIQDLGYDVTLVEDGKVTFTYINLEDENKVNAEEGDHEGLVEIGRDIEGVEVSVFLREKEDPKGYKISLRSNEYVNVSDEITMLKQKLTEKLSEKNDLIKGFLK